MKLNALINTILEHIAQTLTKWDRVQIIFDRSEPDRVYLERYYLLFRHRPEWFPFNVFLHRFRDSDKHEPHDHPWAWCSIVLTGGYWEETLSERFWRPPGSIRLRKATFAHRVILDPEKADDTWTLFVVGKRVREWGYHTESEWLHWRDRVPTDHPYRKNQPETLHR